MESQKSESTLRFVRVAGMEQVYEPGAGVRKRENKHPCPDCHFCQFCSDARCQSCRSMKNRACRTPCRSNRKLSLREQILLYEEINAQSKGKKSESNNHDQ